MIRRRYRRFYYHAQNSPWGTNDDEHDVLETPKSHCIVHMMAHQVIFGPIDSARLSNAEHDHIAYVKDAMRRTRQHEHTQMQELHGVVDRIDAVRHARGSERILRRIRDLLDLVVAEYYFY